MSNGARILWVDDEIDLLKPHILFLKGKGYDVETANNAYDAIDLVASHPFDLIILDEMMPGMTGLETLPKIKEIRPTTPVIMVTKSEEENIMDKAVGSKIADYLIKPVNPNQVLLSIKKNVHSQQLVTEQSTADYRSQFGEIASALGQARTFADWTAIYKRLVGWEVELTESTDPGIREILAFQKNEANNEFSKFVRNHYLDWFSSRDGDTPVLSHNLMKAKVFPVADDSSCTAQYLRGRTGGFLLQYPSYRHPICPQCDFCRADAAGYRQNYAEPVAQRQRGGGQEPPRGGFPQAADAVAGAERQTLFR